MRRNDHLTKKWPVYRKRIQLGYEKMKKSPEGGEILVNTTTEAPIRGGVSSIMAWRKSATAK